MSFGGFGERFAAEKIIRTQYIHTYTQSSECINICAYICLCACAHVCLCVRTSMWTSQHLNLTGSIRKYELSLNDILYLYKETRDSAAVENNPCLGSYKGGPKNF